MNQAKFKAFHVFYMDIPISFQIKAATLFHPFLQN